MKMSEMFPSSFLGKEDLQKPTTTTIRAVRLQEIKGEDGNEMKTVIDFVGLEKSFICNKTNAFTLCDAYGPDSDNWIGKTVELYVDPSVAFGGKRVGGVRLRIPAPSTVWLFPQAISECNAVGISKEDLIAHLKSKGLSNYNGARDTALIQALIASKAEQGFEEPLPVPSGDAFE